MSNTRETNKFHTRLHKIINKLISRLSLGRLVLEKTIQPPPKTKEK